jgi:hypothetical protein
LAAAQPTVYGHTTGNRGLRHARFHPRLVSFATK